MKWINKDSLYCLRHMTTLIALLFFANASGIAYAENQKPYVDDIKKNQAAIMALKKKQEKLAKQYSDEQRLLRSHDKALATARKSLQAFENNLKETQEQLTEVQHQLTLNTQAIQVERQALAHQIRIAYQQGKPHPLKVLLSDQQPGTWEQISVYHQAFMGSRNKRFMALLELQEEKRQQEAQVLALTESLQQQITLTSEQETKLAALKKEQKKVISELDRSRSKNSQDIAKLADERKALENLLALWESRQALSQPFSKQKGKLQWPVAGKIISSDKQLTKAHRKGVFISAQVGAEVKAVHPGQVIFADWLRGFGMMCIIDHGDGFLTLYGHNEALTVNAGEQVKANQTIGFVGNSGGMSQPGVYFELREDGKANNAKQWLAKK